MKIKHLCLFCTIPIISNLKGAAIMCKSIDWFLYKGNTGI